MWLLLGLLIIALFLMYRQKSRDSYNPSDEKIVKDIVTAVQKKRPEMAPINTLSRDGNTARIFFLNTDTYAGQVADATAAPNSVNISFVHENKVPFKM
jgi:hypothetical protein